MSEKTEQPTPKKLREAREKGQVARSRPFSGALVLVGGGVGMAVGLAGGGPRLVAWAKAAFSPGTLDRSGALAQAGIIAAWLLIPPLAGALLAALAGGIVSAGFQLHLPIVAPKLERLNPAEGFKRLFSLRSVVEALKAFVILVVLAAVVGGGVWSALSDVLASAKLEPVGAFTILREVLVRVAWRAALALLVLGGGDFLWAKWKHRQDLMMTREEVKQEYKDSEGDPRHKAERKSLHRQLATAGRARGVQKASAVVINPTHIAVALRYDEKECDAPYLVAKGRDRAAQAIRNQAQRLGIPVVQDIPLARSLVQFDVGEEIPEELYQAAAAVLKVALESQAAD